MKILVFSTLFPNPAQPAHGIFVENRLRHLAKTPSLQAKVVAPVPWVPGAWLGGQAARYASIPARETRHGIEIVHPRYPVIPKVGMTVAPALLALSQRRVIADIIRQGFDFDILDAHYFYPDGVAAAALGRWFNKPVVITGRGTDLSLIPTYTLPRRQIQWAAREAAGMVTVCAALKDSLVELGVEPARVTVLRNGVDLDQFKPFSSDVQRDVARARWGMNGKTLVSVGLLIERKGHHLIISALKQLPEFTLYIAGDGPDRASLERLAQQEGVGSRVRFLGLVPHHDLASLYGAADALVLASSREGWANVLLEAMASGTPVVASRIWGTPEVVAVPEAGVLMPDRSADGVAAGVRALFAALPQRALTRAYAEKFSWDATTQGQLELFQNILRSRGAARQATAGDAAVSPPPPPGVRLQAIAPSDS